MNPDDGTEALLALRGDPQAVWPHFSRIQGVVLSCLPADPDTEKPGGIFFLTDDTREEHTAVKDTPSIDSRFNELSLGALVTFSSNWLGEIIALHDIAPPQQARIIGYKSGSYLAHDNCTGEYIRFQRQDMIFPADTRRSFYHEPALGACITYHAGSDGQSHHVAVESLPSPVVAWRKAGSALFVAGYVGRGVTIYGLHATGEKLTQLGLGFIGKRLQGAAGNLAGRSGEKYRKMADQGYQ